MEKIDLVTEMNKEVLLLRNELAECWWSHNGWKYKHKNKFHVFNLTKRTFMALPVESRKGMPSSEILEKNFLGLAEAENARSSNS